MKRLRIPLSKHKVGEQKPLPYSTKVDRFSLWQDPMNGDGVMIVDDDGDYVSHLEYAWMANYADRLVEFGNLPCLPKDLENLSESNLALATENEDLKRRLSEICDMLKLIKDELIAQQSDKYD